MRHPSNNNEKNSKKEEKHNNKIDNDLKKNSINSKENQKEENEEKDSNYEQFFKDGGFVGETIIDRASIFQAHAIKIKNKEEVDFYKKCLLSQKK